MVMRSSSRSSSSSSAAYPFTFGLSLQQHRGFAGVKLSEVLGDDVALTQKGQHGSH